MAAPTLIGEVLTARRGGTDEAGKNTYTRVWKLEAATADWGPRGVTAAFEAATGIARGTSYAIGAGAEEWYEADANAFAQSIEAVPVSEDGCQWHVTVNYVPIDPQSLIPPTERDVKVSWDSEESERIADFDVDGNPVVNAAGDPFDPPVMVDQSRRILTIERNEADFDDQWVDQFVDKVNANTFYGRAAGEVLCKKITASTQFDSEDGAYWSVRYEFHVNPDGWKSRPLNAGMRQLVSGVLAPILDKGVPVSQPVPLDSLGAAQAPDDPAIFLEYDCRGSADFALLGLE